MLDVFSKGFICPKGSTLKQLHEDPDRLRTPLVRQGAKLVPATWDEALSLVAGRLADIAATHGPSAVGGFSSARCTNEENYLFQKLFRAGLGSNNIDHCARL